MKLRYLYLVFAVLGLILPYSQFIPWIAEHHALNLSIFLRDLFANRISTSFALDVFVSALVLFRFIRVEGGRIGMRHRWLPMLATLCVGVSLGLPMFLYMREAQLEESVATGTSASP